MSKFCIPIFACFLCRSYKKGRRLRNTLITVVFFLSSPELVPLTGPCWWMWERLRPSNSTTIRQESGSIPRLLFHYVRMSYSSCFISPFFRFWIRHPDECHISSSSEINLGLRSLMRKVWQKKMVPSLDIRSLYTEVVMFFFFCNILDYILDW